MSERRILSKEEALELLKKHVSESKGKTDNGEMQYKSESEKAYYEELFKKIDKKLEKLEAEEQKNSSNN